MLGKHRPRWNACWRSSRRPRTRRTTKRRRSTNWRGEARVERWGGVSEKCKSVLILKSPVRLNYPLLTNPSFRTNPLVLCPPTPTPFSLSFGRHRLHLIRICVTHMRPCDNLPAWVRACDFMCVWPSNPRNPSASHLWHSQQSRKQAPPPSSSQQPMGGLVWDYLGTWVAGGPVCHVDGQRISLLVWGRATEASSAMWKSIKVSKEFENISLIGIFIDICRGNLLKMEKFWQ